jgi:hypothetical protein
MSITLNEEQTEVWKTRTLYQFIVMFVATAIAILTIPTPYGILIMTVVISSLVGVLVFLAFMPKIYYHVDENED